MVAYSLLFIVFMLCVAAVIGCFKGLVNVFIGEDEPSEPEQPNQVSLNVASARRVRLLDIPDTKDRLKEAESDGLKSASTNNSE